MREKLPIRIFCGLPVIVAVLPIFEAMAIASRYGAGLRLSRETSSRTSGVSTRQIASLTRKAEKKPEVAMTAKSSSSGWRARVTTQLLTRRKKPERRRLPTTIIMPSSRASVATSIACRAAASQIKARQFVDRHDQISRGKDQDRGAAHRPGPGRPGQRRFVFE